MAPGPIGSRLRYLNDAAHLLSVESPAISAQLSFQYNKIAFENELSPSDARRMGVCGACGNIMVPGWTCHVHLQSEGSEGKTLRKRRNSNSQNAASSSNSKNGMAKTNELKMEYECRVCGRATRQILPKKPPKRHAALSLVHPPSMANPRTPARSLSLNEIGSTKQASANASSKKRAKARKGGLQALLAKKKEAGERTDFGLDLMDLMKKT